MALRATAAQGGAAGVRRSAAAAAWQQLVGFDCILGYTVLNVYTYVQRSARGWLFGSMAGVRVGWYWWLTVTVTLTVHFVHPVSLDSRPFANSGFQL